MLGTIVPDALTQPTVLAWLFGVSLVMFFGSLALMPLLVARMRPDYFVRRRTEATWAARYPVLGISMRVVKNLAGAALLMAGLAMMVLPGQGLITVLVALTLLDFPGKHRLELRIVRQPQVHQVINWIRSRAGQPPLIVPDASKQTS